jgi:uncharacterized protein YqfA (UPF0365 family)
MHCPLLHSMPGDQAYLLAAIMIFLLPCALVAVLGLWVMRLWRKANAYGLPVTMFELVGMKLRRLPVDTILDAMILAYEGEVDEKVSHIDLIRAAERGLDPIQLVAKLIEAKQQGHETTLEELMKAP